MPDHTAFARSFACALDEACRRRGLSQKQLGELIAVRQHERGRPGPDHEGAVARARQQWPRRISAWKTGDRLPATWEDLRRALDVIAPDTPAGEWRRLWAQARGPADDAERPRRPPTGRRTPYLWQVERIAPPDLIGRDNELAELAAFCLGADAASGPRQYAWWQASAWTGKSALLSTFVLHPPPSLHGRIRIVSFFVTARLAAQDSREAFISALTEQLSEVVDRPAPGLPDPARQDVHLLELFDRAAHACRAGGERLVLVVDGLDEDRGVTKGSDAHSIAGLLPAHPPAGMRIIVSGRPHPPVPDDVEAWHPLRDPLTVRPLRASRYAQGLRQRSEQEVRRLLSGTPDEQNILGALVAAGGGLSAPDLHELTGVPLWEIEDVLDTVRGRAFVRRPAVYDSDDHPDVYLLSHEELQTTAVRYLGGVLDDHRRRIHDWARSYRDAGWPPGTPQYLLFGYFGLLTARNDLARQIECASDTARHDRMLELTGGDAAALAETQTALDLVSMQDDPDLLGALAVSRQSSALRGRNTHIPELLPAAWARLGYVERAEALALSAPRDSDQAKALGAVVGVLARTGHADRAEAVARSAIRDAHQRGLALADLARSLAAAGRRDDAAVLAAEATTAVRGVHQRFWGTAAFRSVAQTLAGADQVDQAVAVARSVVGHGQQAGVLAVVARTLATAGRIERATVLIDDAVTLARTETRPGPRAFALTDTVTALAAIGDVDGARALAVESAVVVRTIEKVGQQVHALTGVAEAIFQAGDVDLAAALADEAETMARSMPESGRDRFAETRGSALSGVAGTLAEIGRFDRAVSVAHTIEPDERITALADIASAMAAAGHLDDAVTVAHDVGGPEPRAQALAAVAIASAGAGDTDGAAAVADTIGESHHQAGAFLAIADALAATGQGEDAAVFATRAVAAVRLIANPRRLADVLTSAATTLAAVGETSAARDLAVEAGTVARRTSPYERTEMLTAVATTLAGTGHTDTAEAVARTIVPPHLQVDGLTAVVRALAEGGHAGRAAAIAATLTSPFYRSMALAAVAHALLRKGCVGSALRMTENIEENSTRLRTVVELLEHLAETGQVERAVAAARTSHFPLDQSRCVVTLVRALAKSGDSDAAATTARRVADAQVRAAGLAEVALTLAETGVLHDAVTLAHEAVDSARTVPALPEQVHVLGVATRVLAAAGYVDDAATLAEEATDACRTLKRWPFGRSLHSAVAQALAHAGMVDRAAAVADIPPDPGDRARVLAEVARTLATTGDTRNSVRFAEHATRVATSLTQLFGRDSALTAVAEALAESGHHEHAITVARCLTDPYQNTALVAVATTLARTGRTGDATTVARTITDVRQRAGALTAVATNLNEAGDIGGASELALDAAAVAHGLIDLHSDRRTKALVAVAEVLVNAGQVDHARRVAVDACRDGHWHLVIGAAVRVDASVARLVASWYANGIGSRAE